MYKKIIIGVCAAIITAALVSVAGSANGGIGGRPANPDPDNPRTQSIFVFDAEHGQTLRDAVTISNDSGERQTVELLVVDGTVTNTGAYTCKQNIEERTDLGSWVTLSQDEITVDAGGKEDVEFTIRVPETADVGEHNACLVFQLKDDEGEVNGGVRVRTRQAIRVVATLPGDLRKDIAITSFTAGTIGREQAFTLNLRNTGNVSADIEMSAVIYTVFGKEVARTSGGYPVLPGQDYSQVLSTDYRPMFGGWYSVAGEISYDGVAGTLGVQSDTPLTIKESDRLTIFLWPTRGGLTILLGVVVGIAALITYFIAARARKKRVNTTWHVHTVAEHETITSIAADRGVSWKRLAAVNSIKAPYGLKTGQKIRVPKKKA